MLSHQVCQLPPDQVAGEDVFSWAEDALGRNQNIIPGIQSYCWRQLGPTYVTTVN